MQIVFGDRVEPWIGYHLTIRADFHGYLTLMAGGEMRLVPVADCDEKPPGCVELMPGELAEIGLCKLRSTMGDDWL